FWMVAASGLGVYAATRRVPPALAASTAGLPAWAAAKLVKKAAHRGRPADLLEHVTIREAGLHGKGYVSGHTAIAFALATVVAPLLPPRWRAGPFALASFVGLTRIYYGAHLPLDVVGAAGLGILCGLLSSIAFGPIDPVPHRGRPAPAGGPHGIRGAVPSASCAGHRRPGRVPARSAPATGAGGRAAAAAPPRPAGGRAPRGDVRPENDRRGRGRHRRGVPADPRPDRRGAHRPGLRAGGRAAAAGDRRPAVPAAL